jgi:hypothetical protein
MHMFAVHLTLLAWATGERPATGAGKGPSPLGHNKHGGSAPNTATTGEQCHSSVCTTGMVSKTHAPGNTAMTTALPCAINMFSDR